MVVDGFCTRCYFGAYRAYIYQSESFSAPVAYQFVPDPRPDESRPFQDCREQEEALVEDEYPRHQDDEMIHRDHVGHVFEYIQDIRLDDVRDSDESDGMYQRNA